MKRWEYCTLVWTAFEHLPISEQDSAEGFLLYHGTENALQGVNDLGATLARLGREGWEVISVTADIFDVGEIERLAHPSRYFLKRELVDS